MNINFLPDDYIIKMSSDKRTLDSLFPTTKGLEYDVNVNSNKILFFFFGCWNEDIEQTRKIINSTISTIPFGIVNGDNFYPVTTKTVVSTADGDKIVKNKDFNPARVGLGFDILKYFLGRYL